MHPHTQYFPSTSCFIKGYEVSMTPACLVERTSKTVEATLSTVSSTWTEAGDSPPLHFKWLIRHVAGGPCTSRSRLIGCSTLPPTHLHPPIKLPSSRCPGDLLLPLTWYLFGGLGFELFCNPFNVNSTEHFKYSTFEALLIKVLSTGASVVTSYFPASFSA